MLMCCWLCVPWKLALVTVDHRPLAADDDAISTAHENPCQIDQQTEQNTECFTRNGLTRSVLVAVCPHGILLKRRPSLG